MEFLDRHAVTQVARSIEAAAQAIDAAANAILASRSDPLLEYLYKERDGFDAYHNQKETMAWAGVAVFLAATVAVATSVKKPDPWWETHALQQLVLTVTFFAVLAYTRRQFNLREWAARINEALTRKILEIVDGSATHAAGAAASPAPPSERLWLAELLYPDRIAVANQKHVLHTEVEATLEQMAGEPVRDKRPGSLEHHAYFLMVLALIVATAAIWTT